MNHDKKMEYTKKGGIGYFIFIIFLIKVSRAVPEVKGFLIFMLIIIGFFVGKEIIKKRGLTMKYFIDWGWEFARKILEAELKKNQEFDGLKNTLLNTKGSKNNTKGELTINNYQTLGGKRGEGKSVNAMSLDGK